MERWKPAMQTALAEAAKCGDDVPVGAVLIDSEGNIVATGRNDKELHADPTGHAEIVAIREAAKTKGSWRLDDLTLVVTLEPCVMCAGAIAAARIPRVVFGAWDSRVGAAGSLYDLLRDSRLGTPVEVIPGVLEEECGAVLTQFFESRRMSGSK
jgi:tRNA(adenine34) deaminase